MNTSKVVTMADQPEPKKTYQLVNHKGRIVATATLTKRGIKDANREIQGCTGYTWREKGGV